MKRTCIALALAVTAAGCAPETPEPPAPPAAATASAWVERAALPGPTQEIYPTAAGDALVVAGGFGPAAEGAPSALADTRVYDPAADAWSQGSAAPFHRV